MYSEQYAEFSLGSHNKSEEDSECHLTGNFESFPPNSVNVCSDI